MMNTIIIVKNVEKSMRTIRTCRTHVTHDTHTIIYVGTTSTYLVLHARRRGEGRPDGFHYQNNIGNIT